MVATSIPEALADPVPPPDIAFSSEVVVHQVVHQQGDHQDAGAVPDLRKDVHQGPARGQSDATQQGLHRARAKHRRAWPGSSAQSPATNVKIGVGPTKSAPRVALAVWQRLFERHCGIRSPQARVPTTQVAAANGSDRCS